jgi:hypothetical protein
MSENTFQIHQIMACPVQMVACYFDPVDEEVVQQSVICLAVIRYPNNEGDGYYDFIEPMIGEIDGSIIPADWQDGFLGIEYNGKEEAWDEAIRGLMKDKDKDGNGGDYGHKGGMN